MAKQEPKEMKLEKPQKEPKSEIENNQFIKRTTQVLNMADAAIKSMDNAATKIKTAINLIQ